MHDVQNEVDRRGIAVDQVGIAGLRYPVSFSDGELVQNSIAEVSVTVRLQAERRGTHMSRMVALADEHLQSFDPRQMPQLLKAGAHELDAPAIEMTVSFPVSTRVTAPASGAESFAVHDLTVAGRLDGEVCRVSTSVRTEVTSLCPCSKTISDYGAHNQRSEVTLTVQGSGDTAYPLSVSKMVALLTTSGSAPVIPLVKRPDERVLTMQAYDHPAFVEDMVRDLSTACRARRLPHRVHVRNLESIHSHDAVAVITSSDFA
ncbi:GTP cyclohydrolase, FolE2/MptA family [Crossiella sp. SN42]|uniref:GTP cyclohydrolase I FolE2 n=1 Tax=Crossiella sp. SN42 TaxID=2944808 RepID=UPI00207D7101|nr:GTP cyclohydrolase, FolE2/MptA family [Crossiella sp. SN42]MCO1575824.1 GTP cyclohydrolase, FolE2/MptA family [Crossiella sp. SN42]